MSYIIVLLHEAHGTPYVFHTDKRFHEQIIARRGCEVVEYKTKKKAEEKASRLCRSYTYGKSYAVTADTYGQLTDAIRFVYSADKRLDIMNNIINPQQELSL